MPSLYLNRLSATDRTTLLQELHARQSGNCFICGKSIDLQLHRGSIDVDHVIPSSLNGPDNPSNFALTHDSCNRGKQDSNLRIARVIAKFDEINARVAATESRAANLGDILESFSSGQHDIAIRVEENEVSLSLPEVGRNDIVTLPLYEDALSGFRFFFVQLPIQYVHHDGKLNPRAIGPNVKKLIKEFFLKRPQLHVALGWLNVGEGGG